MRIHIAPAENLYLLGIVVVTRLILGDSFSGIKGSVKRKRCKLGIRKSVVYLNAELDFISRPFKRIIRKAYIIKSALRNVNVVAYAALAALPFKNIIPALKRIGKFNPAVRRRRGIIRERNIYAIRSIFGFSEFIKIALVCNTFIK